MIICINYTDDGNRYVAKIDYILSRYIRDTQSIAQQYSKQYDEVYVMQFKENEAFIDEVVLRGCRV